jgi:hypothetical protein
MPQVDVPLLAVVQNMCGLANQECEERKSTSRHAYCNTKLDSFKVKAKISAGALKIEGR